MKTKMTKKVKALKVTRETLVALHDGKLVQVNGGGTSQSHCAMCSFTFC